MMSYKETEMYSPRNWKETDFIEKALIIAIGAAMVLLFGAVLFEGFKFLVCGCG
jgi:hypothetical protein